MIWLNSISQLQFYNMPVNGICYCDILIFPSDLILQGSFTKGSGNYTITIQTLSANGLTAYEISTSAFEYYFALNPVTQQHFFNARLKSFTTAMCTYACYILRVTVTDDDTSNVVFDKYTERYCQASCCDLARDITFSQENIGDDTQPYIQGTVLAPIDQVSANIASKESECGEPIITLRSKFTCYDYFDGYYWATPSTVLSGSASFEYQKISNMRGRVVKRPRSIERTYSYNCRLQRVESKRVYLFEAYEYFPAWKADEIELQLHSNLIYVDDVQFEYGGGAPFTMANECLDIFRLKTELQDCTQRQVFGCNPECDTVNFDGAGKMFVVPSGYQEGNFYDENKQLVATDYDGLLDYFRNLDGVYGINELATSPLSCETYGAFSVLSYGYIPNSFYYDEPVANTRVFGVILESIEDICPTYGVTCTAPVIGAYYVEDQVCTSPVIGAYYVEDDNSDVIIIFGFGDWADDGSSGGTVDNGIATINIGVYNFAYVENPDSPSAGAYINGDIIANIGGNGRPDINLTFDSNNSILPADVVLTIETNGFVRYFGEATTLTETQATITITGLTYNLVNA